MGDNVDEAEDLLKGSKDQTRHEAEAPSEVESDENSLSLYETIQEYHADMEADKVSENLSFRDVRLAALIRALEDTGQLEDVTREAESALGREGNNVDGRAATLRLLVRIGLQEVAPETIQTAIEARREYVAQQENEF